MIPGEGLGEGFLELIASELNLDQAPAVYWCRAVYWRQKT